ncbi:MAG: NADH-quinone oxidoreductase subunit NuoH [Candidatus Geothermarchaeales archaeon]
MNGFEELVRMLLDLLFTPQLFVPLVYPGFIAATVVLLIIIWLERKISGKVQLRYGPLYVLKPLGGVIQLLADGLKFFFAELILPEKVDKIAFVMSPLLLFLFSFLPLVAIPVSPQFMAIDSDLSLLIIAALMTIAPLFVLVLGWASNNKFAFIGGLREGYLIISYEVPTFLSILSIAILYGSLDLVEIIGRQSNAAWALILNPVAALTFLVTTFLSTSRFPFEIAEADTEIVMGPYTEYSGLLYTLVLGSSYLKLYVLSLLFAILFLGGWNPIVWPLTLHSTFPGFVVFVKGFIIMVFSVFLRAVYPRYRVDQAIRIGWHVLFVLSLASLVLSIGLIGLGVVGE